jgi:hypothetical protein
MTDSPDQQPFSETHLEDPEYRQRLMRKLNCLIAVLEVATAKVRRSLAGPGADLDRLQRIQRNLDQTLALCQRARGALERRERLPSDLPRQLTEVSGYEQHLTESPRASLGDFASPEEQSRFAERPAIAPEELSGVDLDELARRLQGE